MRNIDITSELLYNYIRKNMGIFCALPGAKADAYVRKKVTSFKGKAMNREEQGIEIDLMEIVRTLLGKWKLIILATVLFGALGYAASTMLVTPIYQAGAKMIVNTRKDESQNVTNDQINSAKNLVGTYAVIIRSRDVLNKVIVELNLPDSYGQLANRISIKAVNETPVMQITVQHPNKNTALAVAAKLLEVAPDAIVEKVEAGSVKTVEQAYVGSEPVSASAMRNAVLAAMTGFVLTCAVIIIVFLLDNTYKTDMDIQRDLGLPVLGVIPDMETDRKRKNKKKGDGEIG